jgi:small subunit ribosomal protein S11e
MAAVEQNQAAFQKQDGVFIARKKSLGKKSKSGNRWYKDVGLGFKTPDAAKNGNYVDKKCPFTGNVSIRGKLLKGVCVTAKMERTIIVRRDYLNFVRKYRRFEKRHKNTAAHASPAFRIKEGDVVTVGQCRPLSKTVRFNVLKVEEARNEKTPGAIKKAFRMF